MSDKEFVEKLVAYMKADRSLTLKEKCKKFDITPQIYYGLCRKHNIDGKLGSRLGKHNQDKFMHIISDFFENEDNHSEASSSILKCNPSQDTTELFD